jgi:hypothetical protein
LIDAFSDCLHAKLAADSVEDAALIEAPDVKGLSLFVSSTWSALVAWLKRLF